MRARHVVAATALITARRLNECNFFADAGCKAARPNKVFKDTIILVRASSALSEVTSVAALHPPRHLHVMQLLACWWRLARL